MIAPKSHILALVPARQGSLGIADKNIQLIGETSLLQRSILSAKCSRFIDEVLVSTDSYEYSNIAKNCGAMIQGLRPKNLASESSDVRDTIRFELEVFNKNNSFLPEWTVLLQPTSPFRTAKHIDDAILMLTSCEANSLVSVQRVPHQFLAEQQYEMSYDGFLTPTQGDKIGRDNVFRRQDKKAAYARNGAAIYIFRTELFLETNSLYLDPLLGYEMSFRDSLDIDSTEDLDLARYYAKRS